MGQGAGPYTPTDGWFSRWTRQAFDLTTRSIMPTILILGFSVVIGFCGLGLFSMMPTLWFGVLAKAMMVTVGLFPVLLVVNDLMKLDGYKGISFGDLWARYEDVACAFLIISTLIGAVIMYLSIVAPPAEATEAPAMPDRTYLEIFMKTGVVSIMDVLYFSLFFNPLWLGVIPCMGMTMREANDTGNRMVRSMTSVWLGICLFILMASSVMAMIPMWLAPPVMVFIIAWIYVAAREVFGGINANGERQTAMVPATDI